MRSGCETQHGAHEPGLPGPRYVPASGEAQPGRPCWAVGAEQLPALR